MAPCAVEAGAFGGLCEAAFAEQGVGLLHVAVGLCQRRLALHHPGPRLVAELLHHAAVISAILVSVRLRSPGLGALLAHCSGSGQFTGAWNGPPYTKSAGRLNRRPNSNLSS